MFRLFYTHNGALIQM